MFYNISFNKGNLSWFGLNRFLAFIILLSFVLINNFRQGILYATLK
jgi:hypothetical protein